jgi:voltage-gated potassium channel
MKDWKAKINFWFEDIDTPMGRAVDIIVVTLVFIVSTLFVIKTYPISQELRYALDMTENIIIFFFIIEYILRMWSAPSKVRHFFKIYSIIDLVAIMPFFFAGGSIDYQILRVFRVLRFLRLVRYMQGGHFFFMRLNRMNITVIRIAYIILSIIFVSSGMIFYAENGLDGSQIKTFTDAVYFSIVTLTTVGYGDITPISGYGRFITVLIIVSGIVFIPWQIRDLIMQLFSASQKTEKECDSCGLGYHELDADHCKKCGCRLTVRISKIM